MESQPMKPRLLAGVILTLFVCVAPAGATEPYLEFVKGLRDREYYDYAVLYLEQISTQAKYFPPKSNRSFRMRRR